MLLSLLLCALPLAFFMIGGEETAPLWRENGPVETLSALAYLVGAGAAGMAAFHGRGFFRFHLILWAVFCILFFGEETSWLQHQLGYATPAAVAELNQQGEFNLHNLGPFHGGELLADDQTDGLPFGLRSQHLFQLGFAAFFLAVPFLAQLGFVTRILERWRIAYPGLRFAAFVWLPVLVTVALAFASEGVTKRAIAETREFVYALAIASFLALVYRSTRARPA